MNVRQLQRGVIAVALSIASSLALAVTAPVVEFYNAALDQYHSTLDVNEIRDLDTGVHPGWARTGESFIAMTRSMTPTTEASSFDGGMASRSTA